jgi:hypothetical protein
MQPFNGEENSLAALVRVMEQAVRDGILDRNPAQVTDLRKSTGGRCFKLITIIGCPRGQYAQVRRP